MIRRSVLVAAVIYCSGFIVSAQYPFSLPPAFSATIDIHTATQEKYNNLQLGYNIMGFTSTQEKDLIRRFDPITIRFPHGLFSNWYDWEQDKARVYGTEKFQYRRPDGSLRTVEIDHLSAIKTMDTNNMRVGIDGLTSLNSEKKQTSGRGFDILWTFNMSADGPDFNNGSPVSVARYRDLINRGFEVKAIEMGNECFYPGQRSSIIPNTEDYIARAKSMSAALKAEDSTIQVSVPMLRRASTANPNWNEDLAADPSYFDAVTVHTYVGSDPDDASNSNEAYATALTARESIRKSVDDYAGKIVPDKPIWLSEWGVKSGGSNAVSALGMADCYIFMSENQNRYQRANWFSVNGKLNSFLVWTMVDVNGTMRPRIKYPLEKTAFGSTYEIIRSVFENSVLLGGTVTSPQLMLRVNAVSARAVMKEGKTMILVLNLTDRTVPFQIKLDGVNYSGSFEHKTMAFTSMDEERALPIDREPMNLVKEGSGDIQLPAFSINTIWLKDAHVKLLSSVQELSEQLKELQVYPNPALDYVNIETAHAGISSLKLFNVQGHMLFQAQPNTRNYRLKLNDRFSPGIYFVHATVADNSYVAKVVVKK